MPGFSEWAQDKRFKVLVLLVLVTAVLALGAYSYYTIKQSKYVYTGPTTVSVTGRGEVFAKPDIATFNFSVMVDADNAVSAQEQSAQTINKITSFVREQGVEERDIKTLSYDVSPKYEYSNVPCTQYYCPPGDSKLVGYTANQTIEIKVRDTAKAGELISGVGGQGATNVSGLTFKIDDEESLKREAREMAIQDAKENAEKLADDLDVRLVRFMNFWEETGPYPYYGGMGGEMMAADAAYRTAPALPTGENTISSNVTLVYEIR